MPPNIYQGSKVDENYTVIDKKNGGNFTQHVEFPYDPRMDKCALQLRAEIKCPGGKCQGVHAREPEHRRHPDQGAGCRAGR